MIPGFTDRLLVQLVESPVKHMRVKGLEPIRPKAPDPKSDAAAITPHSLIRPIKEMSGEGFEPIMSVY